MRQQVVGGGECREHRHVAAGRGEAASSIFNEPVASSLPTRPPESFWQQRSDNLLSRARRVFTRETADAIRVKTQDSFLRWKRVEQAIEGSTGAKLDGSPTTISL